MLYLIIAIVKAFFKKIKNFLFNNLVKLYNYRVLNFQLLI